MDRRSLFLVPDSLTPKCMYFIRWKIGNVQLGSISLSTVVHLIYCIFSLHFLAIFITIL